MEKLRKEDEKAFKELTDRWGEWDADGDGTLNANEFETAKIGQHVRGLVATKLADWDWDRDQKVSREEAAKLKEHRRSLVHKSRGADVLKKEPFKPQLSARRPTQAHSPHWAPRAVRA